MPLKQALYIFFGAAVVGAIATLVTGAEPGGPLGILLVLGAGGAALAIERRHLYVLIPLPALTCLVLAILTGLIHDSGTMTSTTQMGLSALQWIGNGFFAMFGATVLVALIFGARQLASRQLVTGSFPMSERRPAPARAGGSGVPRDDRRRGDRDRRDRYDDRDRRDDRDDRYRRDDRSRRGDRDDADWSTDGWRVSTRRPSGHDSRDSRAPRGDTMRPSGSARPGFTPRDR